MAGRWETLILLLCELPAPACAETVDQQRQEVLDEKQKEVHGLKKKKIFLYVFQIEKPFFFFFKWRSRELCFCEHKASALASFHYSQLS